jgi:hypothetical protein
MPRKKNPHDKFVSVSNSTATLVPLKEIVCTADTYKNVFAGYRKRFTAAQYHVLCHVYETAPLSREEGKMVPLPYNVLIKVEDGVLYETAHGLHELLELGYLRRDDYDSIEDHKCYLYEIGPTFLADLQREDQRRLGEQTIRRIADGKLASSFKHYPYDQKGHLISQLNRDALKTLKMNVIHMRRIDHALFDLERKAKREPHYRRRRRLELRVLQINHALTSILRQYNRPYYDSLSGKGQLLQYSVAYQGSRTGRMFERGGGIQSLPREFKAYAYNDILTVNNYDVRSCHPAIIAQLCREAGTVLHWTEEYVNNKKAKYEHAEVAGIPVEIWKASLIGLYYGASLGKTRDARIYQNIWEYLEENHIEYTPDHVEQYYDRFIDAARPFILEREQWLKIIETKLIDKYQVWSNGKKCLRNACGAIQPLAEFRSNREIAVFICQGLEASFVNWLMIVAKEHGYTPRALEHDGLVVDGFIPEEAVVKAREKSGFHTAILEESRF